MATDEKKAPHINLRKVPVETYVKLKMLAAKNNRSIEGEARAALQAYVNTQSTPNVKRCLEVSTRLNFLLEKYNAETDLKINPSWIAKKLGYERAAMMEQYFAALDEPTFAELEKIAEFFCCDSYWLKFGIIEDDVCH